MPFSPCLNHSTHVSNQHQFGNLRFYLKRRISIRALFKQEKELWPPFLSFLRVDLDLEEDYCVEEIFLCDLVKEMDSEKIQHKSTESLILSRSKISSSSSG